MPPRSDLTAASAPESPYPMPDHHQPLIWINVTTSANWHRPAVGIVRVERALVAELAKIYGPRLRQCVWLDGQFVEIAAGGAEPSPAVEQAVDQLLPPTPSFDLARKFLSGRLAQFARGPQRRSKRGGSLLADVPGPHAYRTRPGAGDVLISVGLDWDQPYSGQLHQLRDLKGLRIITCCYDLIPVLFPHYCVGDVAARFKAYFHQVTWGSDATVCISRQSQSDLKALWHETGSPGCRTEVIELGDNIPAGDGEIGDEVARLIEAPFILFVSTIERRKNHEVLYRAYHQLVRQGHREKLPKLVFVGMPGWGTGDLLSDLALDPFTQGLIVQLHHVSDAELLALYRGAAFCVYPSLYEGWGLPVGEALSLGKAVLSSDQGSLPEVGGDLVRYVPAWDVSAWAAAILDWVQNPKTLAAAARRVAKTYRPRDWSGTGKTVAGIADELAARAPAPRTVWPGYDCQSMAGFKVGPSLRSYGAAGFLMYGPFLGLAPGRYTVRIAGAILEGSAKGKVTFDIAAERGESTYAKHIMTARSTAAGAAREPFVCELTLTLDHHIDDCEVRCIVGAGVIIDLDQITITPA